MSLSLSRFLYISGLEITRSIISVASYSRMLAAAPTCIFLRLRRSSAGEGLLGKPGPLPTVSSRRRRRRWLVSSSAALCPTPAPAHDRVFSFAATPTSLPQRVARKAQSELLNYRGGAPDSATAAERVARRKRDLAAAILRAESALRRLLQVPPEYVILFLPGGVSTFFPAVPLNLCSSPSDAGDYVITGDWSERAFQAAAGHCQAAVAWTGQPCNFARLPSPTELRRSPSAKFLHLCADETVQGLEFNDACLSLAGEEEDGGAATSLVADMSSNFCSKPVDVSKFGLIYAGAQGNVGPAGLTVAIVRRDLVGNAQPGTPAMLDFAAHAGGAATLCNSPPGAAIYLCALVFEDLLEQGGLEKVEKKNREKAKFIYEAIDGSGGFYVCPVTDPAERSAMNVRFVLARRDLEKKFMAEAHLAGMAELGAHGGAVAVVIGAPPKIAELPLAGAELLAAFMKDFQAHHQRAADLEASAAAGSTSSS